MRKMENCKFRYPPAYIKTCTYLSVLLSLLLFTACDKEERAEAPVHSAPRQYTLTYTAGENGTIEGASFQKVNQGDSGEEVTAVPDVGYHFMNWSDGETIASRTDADVMADLSVTATFSLNQYTLTYAAGNNGSIDGSSMQKVHHGGAGAAVTAVPSAGYHFVSWNDGVDSATRNDSDVKNDLTVMANFAPDQYSLSYTSGENGTIRGSSSQKVNHGTAGSEVEAVPAEGYHFAGWSDGSTVNPRTDVNVTENFEVMAAFELNQYTLTYTAEGNGTIDGPSRQTVSHGKDGSSVVAVAEKGFHFVSWSDGVDTADRNDSEVTGDLTVSAIFAVNTYAVGGNVSGLVEGTRVVLRNNGEDALTLTENGEFSFATELIDKAAYTVTVQTQPASPNQTCTVTRGKGKISGEDVTDVAVECVLKTYAVGGSISGLPEGDQLVLSNNDGDDLVVNSNGEFTFPTPLDDGSAYEVSIRGQQLKPKWFCMIENATGRLTGREVTDVDVACFPEAVLEAVVGIGRIDLKWNSSDFSGAVFSLCRAKEDIPDNGFSRCKELKGGVLETKVHSPHAFTKVAYDIPYWLQVEVQHRGGHRTHSNVITAKILSGVNDTGIDWCSDNGANLQGVRKGDEKAASCKAAADTLPGQDGHQGRDAAARARNLKKRGSGSAGFDFTKVCMNGDAAGEGNCPPNPTLGNGAKNWACTLDNVTGLIWEVKTGSGLRSQENTYTWYNPDVAVNGGSPGVRNGGICSGSGCDTDSYVQAVNAKRLCGATDWRLPTRKELASVIDNGSIDPSIDTRLFPKTSAAHYWSASTCSDEPGTAWQVYFRFGEISPREKSQSYHVRLVRKEQ